MKAGHISLTGLAGEQAPVGRAEEELAESVVAEEVWGPLAFLSPALSSRNPKLKSLFTGTTGQCISFAARTKLLFLSNRPSLALLINPLRLPQKYLERSCEHLITTIKKYCNI